MLIQQEQFFRMEDDPSQDFLPTTRDNRVEVLLGELRLFVELWRILLDGSGSDSRHGQEPKFTKLTKACVQSLEKVVR